MPLIDRSGSSVATSSQGTPVRETLKLLPRDKYTGNATSVDRMVQVQDTFTTLSSVNPVRYPDVYRMLLAYPKGFPMVVPYYHRQSPSIDIRSFTVSISFDDDVIHEDFTKIHNLEMKLEEPIKFSEQEDDKSAQLTGSAIMYPGLEPFEGDFFIMEIDNKQSMLFIVSKIEPTTFRQERYYKISFFGYSTLTKPIYDRLERAVVDSCYFEKKKYFGESQMTFLSTQSWKDLKELEHLRKAIAQDYVNFFFSKDAGSFFRPDGLYDPYVVEFMRHKLTVREHNVRPMQLVVPLRDYHRTIWYKFTLSENCENFNDLWRYAVINYKDPANFTINYNGLTGKYFLTISDSNMGGGVYPHIGDGVLGLSSDCGCYPKDPRYPHLLKDACVMKSHHPDHRMGYTYHYPECPICSSEGGLGPDGLVTSSVLSEDFYNGQIDTGADPLEWILYHYLTRNKSIDIDKVVGMLRDYRKLGTDVRAFYRWAFYLELADAGMNNIK